MVFLAPAQPGTAPKLRLSFSTNPQPANGLASELADGKHAVAYGPEFSNNFSNGRDKAQNSANDPNSGSPPSKFNSLSFTLAHVTDHLITK